MTRYGWAQLYQGWTWAGWKVGEPFLVVGGGVGRCRARRQPELEGLGDQPLGHQWHQHHPRAHTTPGGVARIQEIRFIYGYPNSIRELCERMVETRCPPAADRGVVCTAEVMLPEVRARISEVLGGVPVLDQWGLETAPSTPAKPCERRSACLVAPWHPRDPR